MYYYPATHKKQTDTLIITHEDLSKDTATCWARRKQYFLVKLEKYTENCADIFEGSITILETQAFSRDGRQPEACNFF